MKEKQLHLFSLEEDKDPAKKRYIVHLPLDSLLLLIIALILSLILAFSWGIEKGRRIAYLGIEQQEKLVFEAKSNSKTPDKEERITEAAEIKEEAREINKEEIKETSKEETKEVGKEKLKEKDKKNEEVEGEKYIIQIASYLKEDRGYQEAKKLESKGYPVLTSKKGKYLVVYVGEFKKEAEARKNMIALKTKYSDCILKIMKNN